MGGLSARNRIGLLLAYLLAGGSAGLVEAAIPAAERAALLAVYASTGGGTDWNGRRWGDPAGTERFWEGVTVQNDHVVELDLYMKRLNGPLPPEVGDLAELRLLNLSSFIDFGSEGLNYVPEIPPEIGKLRRLQLLSLNFVKLAALPEEIGQLESLQVLALAGNGLATLPDTVGLLRQLRSLDLSSNQFDSLPDSLGSLQALEVLLVSGNRRLSELPPTLGGLISLQELSLGFTQVRELPSGLGNWLQLRRLTADKARLQGGIPPTLADLGALETLILSNNQLEGPIPPELGRLGQLRYLELSGNQLTGPIPAELGQLARLEYLFLSGNRLSGDLPPSLAGYPGPLELVLDDNLLSGPIPREFGSGGLKTISLSGNQFSGPIPEELGDSPASIVYLSRNRLSGPIPPQLGNLNALELDLSQNLLSGPIPRELWDLGRGVVWNLDLSGNLLSGEVPEWVNPGPYNPHRLDLRWNLLTASDPGVLAFLEDRMDGKFASTQTVPPQGIAPIHVSGSWAELSWNPIAYRTGPGRYELEIAAGPDGPWGARTATQSKEDGTTDLRGLEVNTGHFVRVRAVTDPHDQNPNMVESAWSEPVLVATAAYAIEVFPVLTLGPPGFTGLALSNQAERPASLLFSAFDAAGNLVSALRNPAQIKLPAAQQLARLGGELFGPEKDGTAWVELASDTARLGGLFLVGGPGTLDGLPGLPYPVRRLVWPAILSNTLLSPERRVEARIVNPGLEGIEVEFQLLGMKDPSSGSQGKEPGPGGSSVIPNEDPRVSQEVRRMIPSRGFLSVSADDLFGSSPELADAYMQAEVIGDGRIVGIAWIEYGLQRSAFALSAQETAGWTQLHSAQLASTPELISRIRLVNTSDELRNLHLEFMEDDGTIGASIPTELPGRRVVERSAEDWFLWDGTPHVGSLVVKCSGAGIVGHVEFLERGNIDYAAAVPLQPAQATSILFNQVADNGEIFTGLALFNPGQEANTVQLAVFSAAGIQVGERELELGPRQRLAQLLRELVPGVAGQIRGYIRVTATLPIVAQQLFGDYRHSYLAAVPPDAR